MLHEEANTFGASSIDLLNLTGVDSDDVTSIPLSPGFSKGPSIGNSQLSGVN